MPDSVEGYEVKALSSAIVRHIARTIHDRFSAESGPADHNGTIYIDYLRNARLDHVVRMVSAVAAALCHLGFDRMGGTRQDQRRDHWTVLTVQTRLDQGNTPWGG